MHERQAILLIQSRDSPTSSQFECGLAHACVAIVAAPAKCMCGHLNVYMLAF